jgi:hypothetical protein
MLGLNGNGKRKRKINETNNIKIRKKRKVLNKKGIKIKKNINKLVKNIPINAKKLFKQLNDHANEEYKKVEDSIYVPELHESASNRKYWTRKTSGEEKLRLIRETLDEFGYKRTDQQKVFHEHMINACLPIIFGDELDYHTEKILKENDWEAILQELLCVTPRRFGKTWAVAMFVATILINVPNIEIVIFSMAMRASRKMLALVDKFISRHERGNQMICRPHNQECLTLRGNFGVDDKRVCQSFPGRSDVTIYIYIYFIILFL